ncbi:MAG: acyl-CoA dehydrogenase family protein, partial [Actinobacteria bacterium]|nr:acyl-CoA dehydrogenase family protein [Actinomycetota bacterium]
MDLSFSPEEEAFRDEVRGWIEANLPAEWRHGGTGGYREDSAGEVQREWQRRLHEGGWLTLSWPRDRGGRGASPVMQAIYEEEIARVGAPPILGRLGVSLLAPLLSVYGSEWQKDAYLEKILSGELVFCQGFSEPNAGSDLAGLQTRAVRKDSGWLISGQKTWSSGAHYADRSFLLARTDPDASPHRGIGMFLVDMRQPGVEVRPIVQLTGSGEFGEIFLSDARVADEDVVGAPTEGWKMAMATFGFERGGLANAARFEAVAGALANLTRGRGAGSDETVRQRVAQARVEAHIFRLNQLRSLTRAQRGE